MRFIFYRGISVVSLLYEKYHSNKIPDKYPLVFHIE
nr:MAG TPA: hypothetical protein [Caudoviricetes sp.]